MGQRATWDPADYVERSFANTEQEANWRQETSRKFHQLMDNAMMVSFFKYKAVANGFPEKVHALDSLLLRLKYYLEGDKEKGIVRGNVEYLVDVANFAMIEFMHPWLEGAFYAPTDAAGSPGRVVRNTAIWGEKPNQMDNEGLPDHNEVPLI